MQMILAYFDPGAGSLILQTLVVGGAGFVVLGRYMLSLRKNSFPDRQRFERISVDRDNLDVSQ
jgi:hypothetical protein